MIEVVRGDITRLRVDAIVNAANSSLRGGGGVDGAIHRAAGPSLAQAGALLAPCKPGNAKATDSFRLAPGIRHVIHTVGPVWHGGSGGEAEVLASCYRRCLEVADELGAQSIAFPAIATGIYGYPPEQAARIAVHTLAMTPHRVKQVQLVAFDESSRAVLQAAVDAFAARPPEAIDAAPATLRRVRAADADQVYAAASQSHDHLRPWMPWAEDLTREGIGIFAAESEANWDSGAEFNYVIMADGSVAGGAGLMRRIGPGGLEIGYWVHEGFTRRGLATAATAALAKAAFELPGVDRVELIIDELNEASAGVPRKLGFRLVGRRPLEHPPAGGSGIGLVFYAERGSGS